MDNKDPETIVAPLSSDGASVRAGDVISEGGGAEAVAYAGETARGANKALHRTFQARHIQMIGIAGSIGSGLFIGSGKALRYGNYPGLFMGWGLICAQALLNLQVMSEACILFPTSGAFVDHCARFVDPALAFALGFCEWFAWHTTLAAEAAVMRLIIQYWTDAIPTAACMTIFLVCVFAVHALPNRVFAEFEFVTAALKVLMMLILFVVCLVLVCGSSPVRVPLAENYTTLAAFPHGFKGIAQCFLLASFSCGGQELLGITNGEATLPRFNLPRAINSLMFRLFFFFTLSMTFISVLVPYTDPLLLSSTNVAASPFVIAMVRGGIRGVPDLLNAVILVGLVSIGVEALYITSRLGTAMARMGLFPAAFSRVDAQGRPYASLLFSAALATVLTYINCSNTGGVIFTWFSSVGSTVYFLAYLVIALTNWRMRAAFRAQHDHPLSLQYAYRNRWSPLSSSLLFASGVFVIGSTFYLALFPIGAPPSASAFFSIFLCFPLFLVLWLGFKLVFRTKWIDPATADLQSGRRPLSAADIAFLDAYYAQPWYKRALTYISL